jgi:hypothetical protein
MLAREKERSLKEEKRRSLLLYKGIQWTGFFFHFLFRNELLCHVRKGQTSFQFFLRLMANWKTLPAKFEPENDKDLPLVINITWALEEFNRSGRGR